MQGLDIIEKRRVHRAVFGTPIQAAIAGLRVHLLDLSTTGARIEHEAPLAVRRALKLRFDEGEQSFSVSCESVRCRLQRSVVRPGAVAYISGLRFTDSGEPSREAIRALVASLLARRESDRDSSSGDAVAV